jgi:hypothetical protein
MSPDQSGFQMLNPFRSIFSNISYIKRKETSIPKLQTNKMTQKTPEIFRGFGFA